MADSLATNGENIPLEIHDLTAGYYKKPVLWGIDLKVPKGKLVGVVGPNGAGKSTLIKAIMGLVPPSSGWVKIFGKTYNENRRRVGYVPQRESVDWDFPVTVMDVVMMGRYGHVGWFKRPKKADRDIARDCLDKVKMLPFAKRQISNLSGGQQQRVFLARALAQESDIYFMDEPFAGVDAATERAILEVLKQTKLAGRTLMVVHHDLTTAAEYFDSLILLKQRMYAYGRPDAVLHQQLLSEVYEGNLRIFSQIESDGAQP